jgi:hypothetical protein
MRIKSLVKLIKEVAREKEEKRLKSHHSTKYKEKENQNEILHGPAEEHKKEKPNDHETRKENAAGNTNSGCS